MFLIRLSYINCSLIDYRKKKSFYFNLFLVGLTVLNTSLPCAFNMAAATRNLFTTWSSRSIRITELLKQTSCRYVFSASLTSFCSGTSNDMKFVKRPSSTNPSSLRHITKNFTRRNRLFINLQKHENTNLKDLTSNRNFDERWISTSAICLNEETSISTGKRKIKERIEKVKEIVHVRSCYASFIRVTCASQ